MSHSTDEVRVVEYWADDGTRVIVGAFRTPETDAMTDGDLIARWEAARKERKASPNDA